MTICTAVLSTISPPLLNNDPPYETITTCFNYNAFARNNLLAWESGQYRMEQSKEMSGVDETTRGTKRQRSIAACNRCKSRK